MGTVEIDLVKLFKFILKFIWIPILCAIIGFGAMYYKAQYMTSDSYTATATMYVYNGNPNIVNYQYTNTSDLNAAEMLVDTYAVIIRSNKVMNAVAERLGGAVDAQFISASLNVSSIAETSVMKLSCTTTDPQLSADICNAVADIAPAEIIRVVSAGSVEVVDYAEVPLLPNSHGSMRKGAIGAAAGIIIALVILIICFMMNRKLTDSKELTDNYDLPILATLPKESKKNLPSGYLIGDSTPSQVLFAYGKLRMNLSFSIHDKTNKIIISSSVPKETKSTVSANLAISFAMDGKHVLLIDGDLRNPTQDKLFNLKQTKGGLSNMLVPENGKPGGIWKNIRPNLDIMTAGTVPPNPTELLNSPEMHSFLEDMSSKYDIVILDTPPINVVTDSLIFANKEVGMLFVTRCNYSDHREIRKALKAAEFTGMNMLGIVMTCATKSADGYYNYHYYKKYYNSYDKSKSYYGQQK